NDLALVDLADLDLGRNHLDPLARSAAGRGVHGRDLDRAVVLDVDRRAGLLGDRPNHGAALADHVANLLRIDLDRDDARRPVGHLLARLVEDLVHFPEDVEPPFPRLLECLGHDLARDALDLDVHLQRGHAVFGPGDLEIHVTEMVLVAEDVRQHDVVVAFLDQAHRNSGHGLLDRHARVHQREARAAYRRHRARAVRFGDFRYDADDVGEHVHVRHHRFDAPAREAAMPDLAPLRRADEARLANAVRREVVVQHERLAALALERVHDLRVAARAERRHDERLRLAAGEERRAVRPRQDTDLDRYRPNCAGVAPVDSRLAPQDPPADDLLLEPLELGLDLRRRVARRLGIRERGEALLLELGDAVAPRLLLDDRVRLREALADRLLDGAREGLVPCGGGPLDRRLAGF